jgi:hypothetical protein
MDIIAEILITTPREYIDMEPNIDYDTNTGERKYSSFSSANLFSHIYNRVKSIYGHDAYPFCIQWSQDLTVTSGGGGVSRDVTPCYIR